ncbi:endonuclease [Actinoplanes sp. ATCC 53533]|uniref:endonuclease/exonuclease/phosphatase family protein n=1 Tax=Actinoplanes sp. ATCC 53533 TaxID=1288362 RepID=UPI000F773152|nr:endonuclease/exonuclease/phosphatase family protein [Actinoplanes sp. ATCC 53533]RSM73605.1 endonuclease [Actinoplanes sp. ATCC 53533]
MTVRLLTWNIRTGGSGGRLDALVTLLRRERPDILALQELRGFPGRRMRQVAGALGMTPFLAPSVFGQAVAVLVRPPLRIIDWSGVRWRLHHAAAAVRVPTTAGQLTVVSTHLHPLSPYRRLREARFLAARHRPAKGPVLLAGDLNALDPGTDHTRRLAALSGPYRRRHLAADGTADTRAIAAFEAAGFVDLWPKAASYREAELEPVSFGEAELEPVALGEAELEPVALGEAELEPVSYREAELEPAEPVSYGEAELEPAEPVSYREAELEQPGADAGLTVPTSRGGGEEFSSAGMRLDYLLASPSVAAHAQNMRVLRGAEAEYASDHYPLAVDLDL